MLTTTTIRKTAILLLFLAGYFGNVLLHAQTSHPVAVVNNTFTPKELTIYAGDTVVWRNTQGSHNVNGKKTTFPNNPVSFGNNVGVNWTYSFVFTAAGVYDYQCDPHVDFGMTGKVTVLARPASFTLTVGFEGMTPHLGQKFFFYLKDAATGLYMDSTTLDAVRGASFELGSSLIKPGNSYFIDFYADHNGNGKYDAPPADHAWRMSLEDVKGDTAMTFTHNVNFTNIFSGSSGIGSEPALNGVNIYPNPATDKINLTLKSSVTAGFSISILNLAGAEVIAKAFQAGKESLVIDISDLSPGLYFLRIASGQALQTLRFIRQ